jgi:hypothetical protein
MGISIYDIYDINHAYIIYFKHTKEFLTSANQEGLAKSTLDKSHPSKDKSLAWCP